MTIPLVPVLEPVPLRTEQPEPEFQENVVTFLDALPDYSEAQNAQATAMNATAVVMDSLAAQAADDAEAAQGAYEALVLADPSSDLTGASTSSVTIGAGSKAFASTTGGARWRLGMWLDVRSGANSANFMAGPVTSLSPLTINVRAGSFGGSGAHSDWMIYPTVPPTKGANVGYGLKTDTASTTSTTWGDTGLEATITLDDPSGRVLVDTSLMVGGSSVGVMFRLVRGATVIAQGDAAGTRERVLNSTSFSANYDNVITSPMAVDTPGSVGPHTYKLQWRIASTGTVYLNRSNVDTDATSIPRGASTITATEIGA